MVIRRLFTLLVLVLCSGCRGDESRSVTGSRAAVLSEVNAPVWQIAAEPSLQIGTIEGEAAYQFDRIRGVIELPDRRIAVLDAGSSELRIFDADGRFVTKTGGRGSGPGEFRRPWAMYLRGDTIFVTDPGQERLSLHVLDGRHISTRAYDKNSDTGVAWLYDNSVIIGAADGPLHDAVRAAVPRLPRPDTAVFFREVRVAGADQLWVLHRLPNDTSPRDWIIFDYAANPIGRVTVPSQLAMQHVDADGVLGVWRDSVDVESVRAFSFVRPHVERRNPPQTERVAHSEHDPNVHNKLRGVLQSIATYQEHYYSRPNADYVYAGNLDELATFDAPEALRATSIAPPPGAVVRILSGGKYGWFAIAADTASGAICGTGQGFTVPQTWSSGGTLACF